MTDNYTFQDLSAPSLSQPPCPEALRRRLADLPVALVHDWLLGMRGGEWVLDALLKLFPVARIYTLFYRPEAVQGEINRHAIQPSALNRLPGVRHYYRWLLPFLPMAIERVRLKPRTRLALVTSHCVAHGIRVPPGAVHVNYYFSPMRYLYDQQTVYQSGGGLAGRLLSTIAPRLRRWDRQAAGRADFVWTLSHFVAQRLEAVHGLKARVIYPPVRTDLYQPPAHPERVAEDLIVSAMVPYKRVDLAIRAANRLKRKLRVVGGGPLLPAMRRLAGPTVSVEGKVSQQRLIELYQTRRCLIFPGEEDFGIVPLEAMACGLPVLGLRAGGLLETMPEGLCGAFFDQPEVASLAAAWEAFTPEKISPTALRANAERFAEQRFLDEVALALGECGVV